MDYGAQTLKTLKELCRKKGAKTTGKKAHLVERLQAYDRNTLCVDSQSEDKKTFEMQLPCKESYLDLNSDRCIPCVSERMVSAYLRAKGDSIRQCHKDLYFMRYIKFIRSSSAALPMTFVHSQVRASKKVNVNYFVDISLNRDGSIAEGQCDCAVGSGPHATCKHIIIVLLALVDHSMKVPVMTYISSTQKLQSFHTCKPHTGSPVKAKDLPINLKQKWSRDPRPPSCRNDPRYQHLFRNVVMADERASEMPIFQAFKPANIRAVAADHTYSSVTLEEIFLQEEGLITLSAGERQRIEETTRSQARSSTWLAERGMRLTASNFGRICKVKHAESLPASLLEPEDITHIPAVVHGNKYEGAALQKLESFLGLTIKESGLQIHPTMPFLAASPDGIILDNDSLTVVETKCPFAAKDKEISNESIPYLINSPTGELLLNRTHNYFYQVQGQMVCAGAQKCYFAVYTHVDFKVLMIPRDDQFICKMIKELQSFFHTHFKPFLIQKFLYNE